MAFPNRVTQILADVFTSSLTSSPAGSSRNTALIPSFSAMVLPRSISTPTSWPSTRLENGGKSSYTAISSVPRAMISS